MTLKHRKFSLDSFVGLEEGGHFGGRKGSTRSSTKKPRQSQSLDEARAEIQEPNLSPTSNMSLSALREHMIAEENHNGFINNHYFIKHSKSFHKLFPEIPEGEHLTYSFKCSLQKEVPYNGRLFVSENHVCFYSSVLLRDTRVVIPASSIKDIRKQSSALSMLSIQTVDEEKYSFISLRNREMCYRLLQKLCSHTQNQGESSPHSSAENEADHDLPSSYSSLEDCDLNLSRDYTDPSILQMPSEGLSRSNSTHESNLTYEDGKAAPWIWTFIETVTAVFSFREIKNLSVLFYIYMMLVVLLLLVSGYIGLRILALQEQLNTLGALTDFSSHHREYHES